MSQTLPDRTGQRSTGTEPFLVPRNATRPANLLGPASLMHRAFEEILGIDELARVCHAEEATPLLSRSQPLAPEMRGEAARFSAIGTVLSALEACYGPRAARGVALRVGRSMFHYGLRSHGVYLDDSGTALRLMPLRTRIRVGLHSLVRLLNDQATVRYRIEEREEGLVVRAEDCPLCSPGSSNEPACYLAVGLLQEALSWVSGGRMFQVEEIECVGRGDPACSFLVAAEPLLQ